MPLLPFSPIYTPLFFIGFTLLIWVLFRTSLLYKGETPILEVFDPRTPMKKYSDLLFPPIIAGLLTLCASVVPAAQVIPLLCITLVLTPAIAIDIENYLLPNKFTFPAILLSLAFGFIFPALHNQTQTQVIMGGVYSVLGILSGGGLMYLLGWLAFWAYGKEAVGAGDLKLMAAFGGLCGWISPFYLLGLAAVIGTLFAILFGRSRKDHIPFGPCLLLAALTWFPLGAPFMASIERMIPLIF